MHTHNHILSQAQDIDADTSPSQHPDQSHQSPTAKQESTETLKQQLKLLVQMQKENSK